jgi:hypothetical protein
MKERKPKIPQPAEDSIFYRVLWFLLATTCLVLTNMADPNTASLSLAPMGIGFDIPLMVLYLWLGITGSFLSYYYRHNQKPWLIGVGLVMIALVIGWFLENLHEQFTSGRDIDILLPTVHLVAGLFVSHTFEMRTRNDFNFSVALSLLLVFMTCTLGKGLLFGVGVLVYICLAGMMLLLDCESRTFGTVCARKIDGMEFYSDGAESADKTGNIVLPIACMVTLGIALFIAVPRAESIADEIAAQFFGYIRPDSFNRGSDDLPSTIQSLRSPIRVPGSTSSQSKATLKPPQTGSESGDGNGPPGRGKSSSSSGKKNGTETSPESNNQSKSSADTAEKQNSANTSKKGSRSGNSKKPGSDSSTSETTSSKTGTKAGGTKTGGTGSGTGGDDDLPNLPENKPQKDQTKLPAKPKKSEHRKPPPESLDTTAPSPVSDETLFTVACNRTAFFRSSTLDDFDGRSWSCSDRSATQRVHKGSNGIFRFPDQSILSIPYTVPTIRLKQEFKFEKDLSNSLLVAGAPSYVEYGAPALCIDRCGTIRSDWNLVHNSEYTVMSLFPLYDLTALRGAPQFPPGKEKKVQELLANFLTVEESLDPEVRKLAFEVSGIDGNWFTKAERISLYLRKNYQYTTGFRHDEDVDDTVNDFLLDKKTGDCKDFASAFVILCRSVGIPTRFVAGYAGVDFDPPSGRRIIKSKHAHAWAEVYVPSGAWVPFDATPGGTMPAKTAEEERYLSTIQEQLKDSISGSGKTPSGGQPGQPTTTSATSTTKQPVSVLSIMLAFCFPSLLAYSCLMFWRGLKNRSPIVSRHPATKIYVRFLRKAKGLGLAIKPSQTPGDIESLIKDRMARMVERGTPPEKTKEFLAKVDSFLTTYNTVYFGKQSDVRVLKSLGLELERMIKKL